jgi:hypothetical protein
MAVNLLGEVTVEFHARKTFNKDARPLVRRLLPLLKRLHYRKAIRNVSGFSFMGCYTMPMTIPTHVAANLVVFGGLSLTALSPDGTDLILLISSNLIDLDHLFSKPIYHPRRNPFVTHPIHRHYCVVICVSLALLLYRPLMFLGIGVLVHFLLDYIYIKREGLV